MGEGNLSERNGMNLESFTQVFRYYPQMSSILFILIIDGLCYGIHISEITHMIPADTPLNMMNLYAGYCNVSLGCGASLGGYMSDRPYLLHFGVRARDLDDLAAKL